MRLIDRGLEAILMEGGAAAGLSLAAGLAGVAALGVVIPEFVEKLRTLPVFNNAHEHSAGVLREIASNQGVPCDRDRPSWSARDREALSALNAHVQEDLAQRLMAAGIDRFPRNEDELAVAADALAQANDPLGELLLVEQEPHISIGVSTPEGSGDMTLAFVQLKNVPEAALPNADPHLQRWTGFVNSSDFMDSMQEALGYAPPARLEMSMQRRYFPPTGEGEHAHAAVLVGDADWAERLFQRYPWARAADWVEPAAKEAKGL